MPLDRVRADALAGVAVGPVDDSAAAGVLAQPEHAVVHLGDRVRRRAAQFVVRALDALEREVGRARVVPDLDTVRAEHPDLAEVGQDGHHAIGRALGAGELRGVDLRAVQQARDVDALAVGRVEDEVAVKIADRHRAGKVWVTDAAEHVRAGVVDVAVRVGRDEQLRAVVGHADRPRARDCAEQRGGVGRVDFVELRPADNVAVALERPQPPNRPGADRGQQTQTGTPLQERRLFAPFRDDLGEEVDHARVSRVRAACDIAGAEDRGLHAAARTPHATQPGAAVAAASSRSG